MSLIKEAKQSLLWTFLHQSSTKLIGFIIQIILARILEPTDYGLIGMITVFIAIGQTLIDGGMTTSLIRTKDISDTDYSTVFTFNIFFSVLVYLVIFCIAPFVSSFFGQSSLTNILRIYSLSFVINSFYAVHIAKFTKELNFKIQFKLQFPAIIIGSFVGVNFALQGYGVWSLVVLHLSQSFFTAMFFWIFLSWKPQIKFKYNILKKHLNFGYKMTISGLLDTVYNNLYKIIIGKFYSPIDVGYFTKADEIRFFPVNQISIILGKVTYPLFVKLNEEREHMLKEAYQWSINISLLATSSIMICLVIIAKDLFYLLLGYKWLPAVPYFQILAIASIFKPIATYNLNILKVKGKSDLFLKLEIIKKITGTLLLLCAIRYNIIGIIWTSCITYIVFAYLNGYYSGKFLGYSVFQQLKDSSKILMQISLPSIICYLMYNYILNNQTVFFKIPLLSIAFFFMIFISIKIFNKNIYNRIAFLLKN